MNYVDLTLIVVLFFCLWESYKQGFILAALGLISWVGSLALGFWGYGFISKSLIYAFPKIGFWSTPLAFVLATVIGKVLLDLLINSILRFIPKAVHKNLINKILSVFPGIVSGGIWMALFACLFLLTPFNNQVAKETRESRIADLASERIGWLEGKLSPVFSEALQHSLPKANAVINDNKAVELPFKVTHPARRADLEAAMLVLVNKERVQRGLNALKADPELAIVARKHSVDMFSRSYFSHYTPEGVDPFGRMRAGGILFLTAGENLALSQTLSIAHTGLMNSPGHRANILNPTFGRLGIGIVDGGIYGIMVTQNFRN
jgi:uncharacterized protein YkwD